MAEYTKFLGFEGQGLFGFNQYPFVHEPFYITPPKLPDFVYIERDLDFDFEPVPVTLQSQYSASPSIKALTVSFENILPFKDIELFYSKIFNIYTAEGVGLDIWGRILGVGRLIDVPVVDAFGFFGSGLTGFNQDNFYYEAATNTYKMPDEAYRKYLLLVKAFSNVSDATAFSINYILSQLFPGKASYVLNAGVMQVRFVFEFYLDGLEKSIFDLGLINRGAGVGYEFYEIPTTETFGFAGSGLQGFNNGVFNVYGVKNID